MKGKELKFYVFILAIVLLWTPTLAAQTVLIPEISNEAELTDSESTIISETVRGVFIEGYSVQTSPGESEVTADYKVECSVLKFGEGFSALLKLFVGRSDKPVFVQSTGVFTRIEDLLEPVISASQAIKKNLDDQSEAKAYSPEPHEDTPKETRVKENQITANDSMGVLKIETLPPGASVYVGGELVGESPIAKKLTPGSWHIRTELSRLSSTDRARVFPGDTTMLNIKYNNHRAVKVVGHTLFWPGLVLAGIAAYCYTVEATSSAMGSWWYHGGGPVVWSIGGTMMLTGVILWIASRKKRKRQATITTLSSKKN